MTSDGTDTPAPNHGSWRSRRVIIRGKLGLHARPAARFVKLASTFDAEIEVANRSGRVSALSIMGLMMLAAASGTALEIFARGADAEGALDGLARFVESGFEDP
ncbi:MAG: HPr family phosphocarrier protein [Alphaproteobacteria bacterium]|nr:HPr family phosphocarrier protein [Alphaproteobacteria bacterium]